MSTPARASSLGSKQFAKKTIKSPKKMNQEAEICAEQLLQGAPLESIDASMSREVCTALRRKKVQLLEIPDYITASRIDDICSQLLLNEQISSYAEGQDSILDSLKTKLSQVEKQIQTLKERKEATKQRFDQEKEKSYTSLLSKQQKEMDELVARYDCDPPPQYRKYSKEVLDIKAKEEAMKKAGLYKQAQAFLEEREALEAFESVKHKQVWRSMCQAACEQLSKQHQLQIEAFESKWETKQLSIQPSSDSEELHLEGVRDKLLSSIQRLESSKKLTEEGVKPVKIEAGGLPKLGSTLILTAERARMTAKNNRQQYTRPSRLGNRRAATALR